MFGKEREPAESSVRVCQINDLKISNVGSHSRSHLPLMDPPFGTKSLVVGRPSVLLI